MVALKYFRDALHVREKACGYVHETTASSCIKMGDILVALRHPDDASIYLIRGINIREKLFGADDEMVHSLKDKWSKLTASELQYDPVSQGESIPHFSRRSPESYLHGYADRQKEGPVEGAAAASKGHKGAAPAAPASKK